MGSKSERFIMRVDGDVLSRWKADAAVHSISVAALITLKMDGQTAGSDLSDAVVRKDAEIAGLTKERDGLSSDVDDLTAALAEARRSAQDGLKPFRDEIAALKDALASRHVAKPALAALRADPANRIIDLKASQSVGHPVLSDPVPRSVSGDAVGFNLKGKGKS